MPLCGKKCSIVCSLLSFWGVLMLGFMSLFFYLHSAAFAEDLEEPDLPRGKTLSEYKRRYEQTMQNCGVAACLYAFTMIVSLVQYCILKHDGE